MGYRNPTKTTFINDSPPSIDAEVLNRIQDDIQQAHDKVVKFYRLSGSFSTDAAGGVREATVNPLNLASYDVDCGVNDRVILTRISLKLYVNGFRLSVNTTGRAEDGYITPPFGATNFAETIRPNFVLKPAGEVPQVEPVSGIEHIGVAVQLRTNAFPATGVFPRAREGFTWALDIAVLNP